MTSERSTFRAAAHHALPHVAMVADCFRSIRLAQRHLADLRRRLTLVETAEQWWDGSETYSATGSTDACAHAVQPHGAAAASRNRRTHPNRQRLLQAWPYTDALEALAIREDQNPDEQGR